MLTQHDKLFTLYAANIAAGSTKTNALLFASDQLDYWIEQDPTPPAQEETGLCIANDATGYMVFAKEHSRKKDRWSKDYHDKWEYIPDWLAIALVGPMTWGDEPRMINISKS